LKAIVAVVLVLALSAGVLVALSGTTRLSISPPVKSVGLTTPVTVHLTNPHGVRRVAAWIEQDGNRYSVFDKTSPASRFLWRKNLAPEALTFEAGKNKAPNLKEGKARLVVEAVSNDFRGATSSASSDVNVILSEPHVIPDNLQHYVNQAGMELVTFTASGSWDEAGVKVGPHTFRSFPLPGGDPNHRFSMFAYAWDLAPDLTPTVFARNAAGTEVAGAFWFKLFPKKFRERDFVLTDELMDKLVHNIDPAGTLAPGPDPLSRFLKINGEMRRKNNQQLADLRFKTEEKVLWNGPFIHYGKEEANFADVRDYMYKGKKVDRQVHLGFDLSDVANAPVNAANDGRVVWADNLGIYGNCVVLDHGYGLQSIYGHLSRIDVKPGDLVKKGGKMGMAGSTGLAEGVHVHFGMQVDGIQINPREWWDEHWIHDRILSKLQVGK
jgi:hypothetical protein